MKKDLSAAIEHLSKMRDCDVVSSAEIAKLFGMNPDGMGVTLRRTQFTKPDVKSSRFLFWSKAALSAEISRRQEKIREQDAVAFYVRLSPCVANFAREMGGGWLEMVLKKEMEKHKKNS